MASTHEEGIVTRTRTFAIGVIAGLAIEAWLGGLAPGTAPAQQAPASPPGARDHADAGEHHEHAPIPPAYAGASIPTRVWTDPAMIARGKEIYSARCAVCHGGKGDGKGPAALNLPLKPADLTDATMVAEMAGSYWFWRVSEGGLVEPFRSKGSAMPAWKGELSREDRWAVIAYAHTFSGHRGPHDATEHAALRPKPRFVTGHGTVVAVRPGKQQIVLEHGEIEGFMEAMTMGYKVTPGSLLDTVKPGDRVRFTIDTESRSITKIGKLKD
jgi:mono/diheme cytochrome c family protein